MSEKIVQLNEEIIKGQMIAADALNCQKEAAEIIVKQQADYFLSVKDNHPNLKKHRGLYTRFVVAVYDTINVKNRKGTWQNRNENSIYNP